MRVMFNQPKNSNSDSLSEFFDNKKNNVSTQHRSGRGSGKQQAKPNFVTLSKLSKTAVYVGVVVNAVSSTIMYYNLSKPFAGSDPAQALVGIPIVVGIIVCVLMANTSSEDNQG